MTSRPAIIGLVVLIVIMAGLLYVTRQASAPTIQSATASQDEAAVRSTVTNFGQQLKNVSLLAPDAAQQMATAYAPYVVPGLIQTWAASTTQAPGRLVSSPWPDRIDIVSVSPQADGSYVVMGNVVEVSSAGQSGALQPVRITLQKQGSAWLIVGWQPYTPA